MGKDNGIIKDGFKGGNWARVVNGALQVRVVAGGGGGGPVTGLTPGEILFGSSTGTIGQEAGLFWDATSKIFRVSNNSVTPTPIGGTLVHIIQANATVSRTVFDTFANVAVFQGRRANGTAASPTALVSGDQMFAIGAIGYGATAYSPGSAAAVQFRADGNWSDTSYPTRIVFQVTASASTTLAEVGRINSAGRFLFGTTTDDGSSRVQVSGDIAVSGNYNGAPTVTGSRATGAALADLLTKLATSKIIVDGTSA